MKFTETTAERMGDPNRFVPMQILRKAIESGLERPDPQGTEAMMYYTKMFRNGSPYNLEVLYDKATNIVLHFKYTIEAIGPLEAIPK